MPAFAIAQDGQPEAAQAASVPREAGFLFTVPRGWQVVLQERRAGGYELEVTREGARFLVRSEPDSKVRGLSDALGAFAALVLVPRLAAIELRTQSHVRLGARAALVARYEGAVTTPEGAARSVQVNVTVLRDRGRRFFLAELLPEGATPALAQAMETLTAGFDLRRLPGERGAPRDPEVIDGRRTKLVVDKPMAFSVRVPVAFKRRVRGRGVRRVLTLSSPRGSIRLRVRAFFARSAALAAHFRAYEKQPSRRPGLRALQALPDAGGDVRIDGATGRTQAYRARMGRRPARVLATLIYDPVARRAYEVELAAHRDQFVLREDLLTRILASIRPTRPRKPESPLDGAR